MWQGDWQYDLPGINRTSVVCSLCCRYREALCIVCSEAQGAAWWLVPFSRYSHKNVPSKLQISCLVAGDLCTDSQAYAVHTENQIHATSCLDLKWVIQPPIQTIVKKDHPYETVTIHLRSSCWSEACLILTLTKTKTSNWLQELPLFSSNVLKHEAEWGRRVIE